MASGCISYGIAFSSGSPLETTGNTRLKYSQRDNVRWGVCEFMGRFAYVISDDAGLVDIGIAIESAAEAGNRAQEAVKRYWPEGATSITRNDAFAAEIMRGAMTGQAFALHIVATPFQERVWRTACTIPRGETRTYGWIAERIGAPKASRAVANALSRNPVAIVVPCHRVVPSTGGVGGYACGSELKARLLDMEKE